MQNACFAECRVLHVVRVLEQLPEDTCVTLAIGSAEVSRQEQESPGSEVVDVLLAEIARVVKRNEGLESAVVAGSSIEQRERVEP